LLVSKLQHATSLLQEYWRTADVELVAGALAAAQKAHAVFDFDCEARMPATIALAKLLLVSYEERSAEEDLHQATRLSRFTLVLCPVGHKDRAAVLNNLGCALRRQYQLSAAETLLEECITCHRQAMKLYPSRHPDRHTSMQLLATALHLRFRQQDHFPDLEEAISYHRVAWSMSPILSPENIVFLDYYCDALIERYNRWHESLQTRSQRWTRAHMPGPPPMTPHVELEDTDSGRNKTDDLYKHLFSADVIESISLRRRAIQLCSPGHPHRWRLMAKSLELTKSRFDDLGLLNDLDEVISLARQMCLPQSSRSLSSFLNSCILASHLAVRFQATGEVEDALEVEKLDGLPFTDLAEDTSHFNDTLGELSHRGVQYGAALQMVQAVDMRDYYAEVLLDVLTARYLRLSQMADAESVIWLMKQPYIRCSKPILGKVFSLQILGQIYLHRFRQLKEVTDAISSRSYFLKYAHVSPHRSGQRFSALCSIAELYLHPAAPFHDAEWGLRYLTDAVTEEHHESNAQLTHITSILKCIDSEYMHSHRTNGLWERSRVLEVYSAAVRLLNRTAFVAMDRRSRLHLLAKGRFVANTAASYALDLKQPLLAIDLLEQGRAVFWSYAILLRSRFTDIPGDLGLRTRCIFERLKTAEYGVGAQDDLPLHMDIERRTQDKELLRSLTKLVRLLPGLERFMLPASPRELLVAAEKGPVVILVSTPQSCHAILVTRSKATSIPLPFVTDTWLSDSRHYWSRVMVSERSGLRNRLHISKGESISVTQKCYRILATLWTEIVFPIFNKLELQVSRR
jgi:hypothetical protein